MENCLFCKIIKGDIPSTCVYQDEKTYAFRDIAPMAPTHVLVVPKAHITGMSAVDELDDATLAERRAKWVCPEPKVKTGYLARYAKLVSSADKGAILS